MGFMGFIAGFIAGFMAEPGRPLPSAHKLLCYYAVSQVEGGELLTPLPHCNEGDSVPL